MRDHVKGDTAAGTNLAETHSLVYIDPDLNCPVGRDGVLARYLRALRNLFPQTP